MLLYIEVFVFDYRN